MTAKSVQAAESAGRHRITAIFAAVLVTALAASVLVLRRVDQLRGSATLEEVLYVPSAKILKRMSLGYDGLLADVYWTRAVQYFGRKLEVRPKEYNLLAPLLDITSELDPHLVVAYQFGSIFLSQRPPEGAGQADKAVALVERGIRENPNEWRLYYNLGWIEYDRKDYAAASSAFERGSKVPGAAPAMAVMAAAVAQHGGEIQTARLLWTQLYNTTVSRSIRVNAIKHLEALRVDEDVASLEQVLQRYEQSFGHYPATWAELRASGWSGSNIDPLGQAYVLKPDGRVEVQDPDQFPFISRGLPVGTKPPLVPTPNQRQLLRKTESAIKKAESAVK
jgi:tetratricopeptide (TPR) repeat protein